MKVNCIAMDTHGKTTDICCKKTVQSEPKCWHVPTTIPRLREVIESIARPRWLTFEEGPLADWLNRELRISVDKLIVCDPRRNALVVKDGDADDRIDARKLCDLLIGGYLRPVHHSESLERSVFKRQVGLYHERMEHRVSEANKIIGRLKGWGVIVREKDFADAGRRKELLGRLGDGAVMNIVREQFQVLLRSYDQAVSAETAMERGMRRLAKGQEIIERLQALPGIAIVRACTFVAYLDTPWRFASKEALWKYLGIGLKRMQSGESRTYVCVDRACNRRLKAVVMGAAESVILQGDNPFARQHQKWLAQGISPPNAKRNVARSIAAVEWGMWKNGGVYDPDRVGVAMDR